MPIRNSVVAIKIEDGIFHRTVQLARFGAEHDQAEGRDQEDFEPDIEVKTSPVRKGTADTRHQSSSRKV